MDIRKMMAQAQEMQEKLQRQMAEMKISATAGGGMVIVTANGKGEILKVQIDKQAVDPRDVPMLEDLILAAVNSALRAAQEAQAAEGPMSQMPDLSGLAGMFGGGGGGGFPR